MRYMPKPGQAAPQGPVRPQQGVMGPKQPIKKPIAAQPVTAVPVGRTKGGIGMTGGPKPTNPRIAEKAAKTRTMKRPMLADKKY